MQRQREPLRSSLATSDRNEGRSQRLGELLSLAKQGGIGVLVVNMPVSEDFLRLWPDQARIETYRDELRSITGRLQAPLVDLYEAGRHGVLPGDAFWDDHHVTAQGAATLTACLTPAILQALESRPPASIVAPGRCTPR